VIGPRCRNTRGHCPSVAGTGMRAHGGLHGAGGGYAAFALAVACGRHQDVKLLVSPAILAQHRAAAQAGKGAWKRPWSAVGNEADLGMSRLAGWARRHGRDEGTRRCWCWCWCWPQPQALAAAPARSRNASKTATAPAARCMESVVQRELVAGVVLCRAAVQAGKCAEYHSTCPGRWRASCPLAGCK
jgi:hypothetical protein